jgi:hypothetical protein
LGNLILPPPWIWQGGDDDIFASSWAEEIKSPPGKINNLMFQEEAAPMAELVPPASLRDRLD